MSPGESRRPAGEHALRVLEFPRVLSLVAAGATSELGAARVRDLVPRTDRDAARSDLLATEQTTTFLVRDPSWAPGPIPDVRSSLERLALEESWLDADALSALRVLLTTSRTARRQLRNQAGDLPSLSSLCEALVREPELEGRLQASLDPAGGIADGASSELRRLRRELRERRAALVERLERFTRGLPDRFRVPDGSITLRNGRYCVPIRREGRSSVGGIVHDESGSRQTLFVEPPAAIEAMNAIRERELAEAREEERVLRELTGALRPLHRGLEATLEALTELDSLYARARYALDHGGARPELGETGDRGVYRVVRGRHPLLAASETDAVPFDLELEEDETALLVSGPNAGGKTVLLKSIGLLSAMSQSGIIPPVGRGTRLPFVRRIFAVIGDEQSIEASLSTFSAQVRNLRSILRGADEESLVLIDEIGSATDPAEGSALAAAILTRVASRAALTVATTHLGDLKALAGESPEIVNASLEFDRDALRPTFRLVRDRPGRSYALEIAGRLGLPESVLAEARRRMSEPQRTLDRVLDDLEAEQAELARRTAEARRLRDELEARSAELEEREDAVRLREREVERAARRSERRYLKEARARVEATIERLESEYAEALADAEKGDRGREAESRPQPRAEAASRARSEVERALRESRERPEPTVRAPEGPDLMPGDVVRLRGAAREGAVEEVRGDRIVVRAEDLRLTVPRSEVEPLEDEEGRGAGAKGSGGASKRSQGVAAGSGSAEARPELTPRSEIDLRGLRVDEAETVLLPALDAAIVADLPRLRIIHGKGTGALRERVSELLAADRRVPSFRPGDAREGGHGVTVVEFGGPREGTDG